MASEKIDNAEIDYQANLIDSFNIEHPALRSGLAVIKAAYESVETHRKYNHGIIPSRYRPQCGIIVGDAGSGKTTLCEFVKNSLPETEIISNGFKNRIIPCVYISLAHMNTPKAVTAHIVEQYGQKVRHGATADEQLRQVKALFSTCQTSLVLLDEIHETLSSGRGQVMAWLKSLVNETKVSIFIAGTLEVKETVDSNSELQGRFYKTIELHYMQHSLTNQNSQFAKYITALLSKINETLPFDDVFTPNHEQLAQLYLATNGNLRNISTLFIEASKAALEHKSTCLTVDFIDSAFNHRSLDLPTWYKGSENPFTITGNDLNKHLKMLGVR